MRKFSTADCPPTGWLLENDKIVRKERSEMASPDPIRILVNLKVFLKDRIRRICYNVKCREESISRRVYNAEQVN